MELMAVAMVQGHTQHPYEKGDHKTLPQVNFGFDAELASRNGIKQEVFYDSSPFDTRTVANGRANMRKLVNKLGGSYCSGKPLSLTTRRQIVAMVQSGLKACDISRQLQISHGCVSKIIAKWRATGSFEPRRIGGSKPKKTIGDVVAAVRTYKRACPTMRSLEIRRRLLEEGVCTECNVPSLSSINRIIRMKLRDDLAEFEASAVRDLMAILASSTARAAENERCPQQAKLPGVPAPTSCLGQTEQPEAQASMPVPRIVHEPEPRQLESNSFNCNFFNFETKTPSLPTQQSAFTLTPQTLDGTSCQTQSGVISKNRYTRNSSTASTSSSYCTDASNETPWKTDWCLNADANTSEPPRLYPSAFGCPTDLRSLNFDNDDLWSLLEELL